MLGELQPLVEMSPENWEHVIRTNLTGTFLLTQAVVRHMLERGGGGTIVNILAIQPHMPLAKYGAYIASKGGLEALNRALAVELAGRAFASTELPSAQFIPKVPAPGWTLLKPIQPPRWWVVWVSRKISREWPRIWRRTTPRIWQARSSPPTADG